jgi:hypothetical protein
MLRLLRSLLWLGALSAAAAAPERIVAVGDVHGAYPELLSILQTAGLADESGRWSGGGATLVQTGDLLDRGPYVRDVVDLLRRLQEEAPASGGHVEVLLGNHEQMTLIGEYRDVAGETWAQFADDGSQHRREAAWRDWKDWAIRHARERGTAPPRLDRALRERWLDEHPLGFLEYVEAFGPEGEYGRWLRQRPLVATAGGTLFIHAGIAPRNAELSVAELNARELGFIERLDRDRRALVESGAILPFFTLAEIVHVVRGEAVEPEAAGAEASTRLQAVTSARSTLDALEEHLGEDSLFWYRGWSDLPAGELAALGDHLADSLGVERFVAAHTPARDGSIRTRLEGRFAFIDTGMLGTVYDGRPSALELLDGALTALYVGAPSEVLDDGASSAAGGASRPLLLSWRAADDGSSSGPAEAMVWRGPDGEALPFSDEAEIERFLAGARILSNEPIPEGITKPRKLLLEADGVRAHAAFRYHHDEDRNVRLGDGTRQTFFIDSFRNEVAAYRLSRLLGMRNLPPAVLRTVDRKDGSLQLWIEGARTQEVLQEEGIRVPVDKLLRRNRQSWDMKVFDNLINNIDRNAGNIVWDQDWSLWLIDHTRAFARSRELLRAADVSHCSRALFAALETLDEETLETRMEGLLGRYEIRALLVRRDLLVRRIRELIAEQGEEAVLFDHGDPGGGVKVSYDEG